MAQYSCVSLSIKVRKTQNTQKWNRKRKHSRRTRPLNSHLLVYSTAGYNGRSTLALLSLCLVQSNCLVGVIQLCHPLPSQVSTTLDGLLDNLATVSQSWKRYLNNIDTIGLLAYWLLPPLVLHTSILRMVIRAVPSTSLSRLYCFVSPEDLFPLPLGPGYQPDIPSRSSMTIEWRDLEQFPSLLLYMIDTGERTNEWMTRKR
jgi:hypothetical protein